MKGMVYIVGAGPGDPALLTVKALDLMKRADIVLYDRLVGERIVSMIPFHVEKEYVGRSVGDETTHQDYTNELMKRHANEGKVVVRLKGGDPFIFGRGGEEAEFLKENGINFEIVPGISSAIASPAYAGIPLTHRTLSSSVAIVTGHEDPDKPEQAVKWKLLCNSVDTVVILMGVAKLDHIVNEIVSGGTDRETLVAVIESGTTDKERVLVGNLENIVSKAKEQEIRPPAIIVIGKVVQLASKLHWRD